MSVYKPTNCRPFAGAVDITKAFFRYERDENGTWKKADYEPIYASCRLETTNTNVIGYRMSLYEGDGEIFAGDGASPVSELPSIPEEATANTGVNGTYLRIPLFRSIDEATEKGSLNTIYVQGIVADYVIAKSMTRDGEDISINDIDNSGNWTYFNGKFTPNGYTAATIVVNGGCEITDRDTILVAKGDEIFLCVLDTTPGARALVVRETFSTQWNTVYVRKGAYSGFFSWDPSDSGKLKDPSWQTAFRAWSLVSSSPLTTSLGAISVSSPESNTFSWKIDLYQGPEDYQEKYVKEVPLGDTSKKCKILNSEELPRQQYDMTLASGTILGTCAKRLHLRSVSRYIGERPGDGLNHRLPGFGLEVPPVLIGTYCEITGGTGGTMIPSFPIASYDTTLGTVYPNDGALTQEALNRYPPAYDSDGKITSFPKARFYKYSSSTEDILSNEKVRVCVSKIDDWESAEAPRPADVLKPGAKVNNNNITLAAGDRVLWNTLYWQGVDNGIWVVGNNENEPPYRPADGDNWSDYIGKVTLVVEGSFAGTVMESTATAGGFELGSNGLFFRKQTPVKLFSETGIYDDNGNPIDFSPLDELDSALDPLNFVTLNPDGISASSKVFPVLDGTNLFGTSKGAVFLNNDKELERIAVNEQPTLPSGKVWISIGQIDGKTIYTLSDKGTPTSNVLYYKVAKGFDADSYWAFAKNSNNVLYWAQSDLVYSADILYNDSFHTYISPSPSVFGDSYLKLRDGAQATFLPSGAQSPYIKIKAYDSIVSCIEHERLKDPLAAEANNAETPPTPYRYDIKSCCRGSDVNGFVFAPMLASVINDEEGKAMPSIAQKSGFDVELSADVFAPAGIGWREGRWIFGSDSDKPQDTGWFHNGTTDCVFAGLEPASAPDLEVTYEASFYARDEWGRVASSQVIVQLSYPEGRDPFPGTLVAEADCTTQSVLISYISPDSLGENESWIPGGFYDLYKREYAVFQMDGCAYPDDYYEDKPTYYGPWEPVAIGWETNSVRDFNVKQGCSYQYAIFPRSGDDDQKDYDRLFANGGEPVYTQWSDWSIVELNEVDPQTLFSDAKRHPAVKKAYKADINNVWLFKYDVEEGSQTVNLMKNEFTSMGEFPRYFGGKLNAESGDISCWLGSEIAKGGPLGYVERRRRAISSPLSVNEAAAMLADWRKIVKSDKPKLLKDRKGRSWIVQISGGSSTTQGLYSGRPTKISFSWKQIGDPADCALIYGEGHTLNKVGSSGVWAPNIKSKDDE